MAVMVVAGALAMFAMSSDGAPALLEPTDEVTVIEAPTPHAYLYQTYPALARRLDCVIWRESDWDPNARNPYSGAAGLTQILLSTWLTTPQGKRGESRFNPYSNLDAAAWLIQSGGGWRHWAQTIGGC